MKVITEYDLKEQLNRRKVDVFYLGEDERLTMAAKDLLDTRGIAIKKREESSMLISSKKIETAAEEVNEKHEEKREAESKPSVPKAKYVDYETGAFYMEKPENMTQLKGNLLVGKESGRIQFRGKMDSLQARIVLVQTFAEKESYETLRDDLGDVLTVCYKIMECDVFDKPMEEVKILGMDHAELRAQSHNPMKYYEIKQLLLPHYSMGSMYSWLNCLRAEIREAEVYAIRAFKEGSKYERLDIIQTLNRLSSALHIMQCRLLAGYYKKK